LYVCHPCPWDFGLHQVLNVMRWRAWLLSCFSLTFLIQLVFCILDHLRHLLAPVLNHGDSFGESSFFAWVLSVYLSISLSIIKLSL
jgi:hypothetical protein